MCVCVCVCVCVGGCWLVFYRYVCNETAVEDKIYPCYTQTLFLPQIWVFITLTGILLTPLMSHPDHAVSCKKFTINS